MSQRKVTIALRLPKEVARLIEQQSPEQIENILNKGLGTLNQEKAQCSEVPPMLRTALLELSNKVITKDRAATHGKAEDSFQTIAAYWSVYLSRQFRTVIQVSKIDVAQLMVLFKTARAHNNPGNMDNWVDQIGYSALGGEIAVRESESVSINSEIGAQENRFTAK